MKPSSPLWSVAARAWQVRGSEDRQGRHRSGESKGWHLGPLEGRWHVGLRRNGPECGIASVLPLRVS